MSKFNKEQIIKYITDDSIETEKKIKLISDVVDSLLFEKSTDTINDLFINIYASSIDINIYNAPVTEKNSEKGEQKNRFDRLVDRAKDHRALAIILLVILALVGIGAATDSVDKVISFGKKYILKSETRSDISNAKDNFFSTRLHTSMVFAYPGPLVYVYTSNVGRLIAPIGYAVVLEIVNNRSTATKISSYQLDAGVSGQWIRLYNLTLLNPLNMFWINNSNLKTCTRLDFRENGFDPQARNKNIPPGESLKGWMFFEWPSELRNEIQQFDKIRLQIENVQGNIQTFVLDHDFRLSQRIFDFISDKVGKISII